ncbi:MAG: PD-(D/E)XK nuclease family protein, partial [Selenomonadaceae bacterium]|nr:PD-(D/E)XK nuclease family protein [Selenomonadaceae bacterium]
MVENELRNLVYDLLSPEKNRKCWRLYLELFDKHVLRLEMTAAELDSAKLAKERHTKLIPSSRPMDLVIITSKRFIPLEFKMENGYDRDGQCYDYWQEAKSQMSIKRSLEPPVLYYLSPQGYFPDINSAKDLGYDDYPFFRSDKIDDVSFRSELLHWVKDCLKQTPKNFPCRKKLEQLRSEIHPIIDEKESRTEKIMDKFFTAFDERFDENFCRKYHLKRGSNRRAEVGDAYDYKRYIDRFFGRAFSWPSICLYCTDSAGNVIKLDDDKELCFRVGCYNDKFSYLDESRAFCAGFIIFFHKIKQGLYKEDDIKPLLDGKNILPQEFVDEYDKKFNGLIGRTDLHDAQGKYIDFY